MNKSMIKNSYSLDQLDKKLNFSKQEVKEIQDNINLYDLVHELRKTQAESGLTQSELADLAGIPRPEVSKVLNGKVNVSIKRLANLASALGKRLEIRLV